MTSSLTDPEFIARLEALHLLARKVLGGTLQANRRTTEKGAGITFADHSEYSLGDDIRAVDWRVYARLESLMIKLFEHDEDTTLYLLVDASRSMASKFDYARRLGAALGFLALNNDDPLVVHGLADSLQVILEPSHGRGKVLPFLRALEGAELLAGDSDFDACVRTFGVRHRRPGMVVVVSDFLFPAGFEEGLQRLTWAKHDVFCLQVQDAADRRCDLKGDVELECVETGRLERVTITSREVALYEEAVRAWNERLRLACARRGIGCVSTTVDVPYDEVILNILRRGGLVA